MVEYGHSPWLQHLTGRNYRPSLVSCVNSQGTRANQTRESDNTAAPASWQQRCVGLNKNCIFWRTSCSTGVCCPDPVTWAKTPSSNICMYIYIWGVWCVCVLFRCTNPEAHPCWAQLMRFLGRDHRCIAPHSRPIGLCSWSWSESRVRSSHVGK